MKTIFSKCWTFLLVFAAMCTSARAQQGPIVRLDGSTISPTEIDRAVVQSMDQAHVTGVGIAVFNQHRIAYLKTYGFRDTEKRLPLTPDSIMTAASLSKSAFATMVMGLVHDKIIDLDKPVCEYLPGTLPEYRRYHDLAGDPRYKQITMRMLLDHTSGFPNWRWAMPDKKLGIYFQPGTRFGYSGEGIDLAQLTVEIVTNRSITELMDERLFRRLGMTRTSMVWEPRFESDFANGYDEQGKSLGPERRQRGDAAGGMQTTLRDYARLVQAVLDRRIPDARSRQAMLSPQIQILSAHEFPSLDTGMNAAGDRAIRLSYGLGWGLFWTPYGKAFFKEGHDDGWRHYVVCFDSPKTGMLIMTNSSNGEDIYDGLLRTVIRDSFTPLDWEGFRPAH
ncbi:MAG TPA: serine hydrolase domain-containing protein [Candidatus Acidoferrum sp.]|nr:serine hydrolase domain-containing protein [Candidatus Acidoferrum sp.]